MSNRFEDLTVWQESMNLCKSILTYFENSKNFSFKDQITRSAISIPSNIAEGFERESNKEFIRFLVISKGSCGELRTQLYIGIEAGYIKKEVGLELVEKAKEISYMLNSLIKKRKAFLEK